MPTFPLFDPAPPHPDAWHDVLSPGGYEWWYFDAEDLQHDRQIVAIFFDGFVFHPGYLRADKRYRTNPMKVPPAVAHDYPCVYFVLYEQGKIRKQFMTQYASHDLTAARDRLAVKIGQNAVASSADAISLNLTGTPWQIGSRGPALLTDQTLSANLRFQRTPTPPIDTRVFLSRAMTGDDHFWHLANPLCRVTGTIDLDGESIPFAGRGYHDHNYGTGPLGPGLKRWMWGRVLREDSACVFHFAEPRAEHLPAEIHLLSCDHQMVNESVIAETPHLSYRRTSTGLAYPTALQLGKHLALSEPRLIDASPFYLRLQYTAEWNGVTSKAFCEIAYPHRLRWPVLGRMIEMSIDKTNL